MGRAKIGAARHQSKKRTFKAAKGYHGPLSKRWRLVQESVIRAGVNSYRDRHRRKREFRALWVTRLTAACRARGINYSRFVEGLFNAHVELNRKMLSEMAINSPADFDAVVELAKQNIAQTAAA
ncbi:MAG: 50S ribosomal protein L20 [Planctomycetota bacterium]